MRRCMDGLPSEGGGAMAATNRPDDSTSPGRPAQSKGEEPREEHRTSEPRGEEVEDLPVADEEISEQVVGGRKPLGQDMDPY